MTAARSSTSTGDSDLLTRVRAISYSPSAAGYGSFTSGPDRPVSVLVRGVIVPTGLLAAFRAFVRGESVGGVTFEEFMAELPRDARTRTWLADQIRNVQVGQHEWLPVSIGYEVLQHAVETGRDDLRKAMGWIDLLATLRSPTNAVLWRILSDPVVAEGAPPEGPQVMPQGHVAALSLDRYTLVQNGLTVGTGTFHDALRDFFRTHRSMDPAAWVDALLAHLPSIMWTGTNVPIPHELRNRPVGVFYRMSSSGLYVPDLTVAQIQAEQQARWEHDIVASFRAAKAGIR